MSTLDDPLIRASKELGTPIFRRIQTALVAVFLLLGFQPVNGVQAHQEEPGLVVSNAPVQDYLEKPLIVATKITPPPVVKRKPAVKRGVIYANGYAPGYCTAYAATLRPDLPRNLGNARTWTQRASAQGIAVGTEPHVGAIVQTRESRYGHVAFVLSVNTDRGTIRVTEANYKGWNVVSEREIDIGDPKIVGYIY